MEEGGEGTQKTGRKKEQGRKAEGRGGGVTRQARVTRKAGGRQEGPGQAGVTPEPRPSTDGEEAEDTDMQEKEAHVERATRKQVLSDALPVDRPDVEELSANVERAVDVPKSVAVEKRRP